MSRTPKEAKQELLNDIVFTLRNENIKYQSDISPKEAFAMAIKKYTEKIKEIAARHDLSIPPIS